VILGATSFSIYAIVPSLEGTSNEKCIEPISNLHSGMLEEFDGLDSLDSSAGCPTQDAKTQVSQLSATVNDDVSNATLGQLFNKQQALFHFSMDSAQGGRRNPRRANSYPTKIKSKARSNRPLCAYNFFFKDERARLTGISGSFTRTTAEEKKNRRKHPHKKISFEELGRMIGAHWKGLNEEQRAPYEEMARVEKMRYEAEKASLA
jgi:hypothetical protein